MLENFEICRQLYVAKEVGAQKSDFVAVGRYLVNVLFGQKAEYTCVTRKKQSKPPMGSYVLVI